MKKLYTILVLACLVVLPSCAMQRAKEAEEAQSVMKGMSKDEIFECMGLPKKQGTQGQLEIWSYHSGSNYRQRSKVSSTLSGSKKTKDSWTDALGTSLGISEDSSEMRYCTVQVLFKEDRVKAVRYSGPTGGFMTDDEQCAYAVRNCLPK